MEWYIKKAIDSPRNRFLTQIKKPFEGVKYYAVVMDIDTFDNITLIDNCWFKGTAKLGFYAMHTENGIFEMVTGKKLTVMGEADSISCIGIRELNENDYETVGRCLVILENDPKLKEQYINLLNELSEKSYKTNDLYIESVAKQKSEKEEALQYLKSYKLPGTN